MLLLLFFNFSFLAAAGAAGAAVTLPIHNQILFYFRKFFL
jgi:hypothetical protein